MLWSLKYSLLKETKCSHYNQKLLRADIITWAAILNICHAQAKHLRVFSSFFTLFVLGCIFIKSSSVTFCPFHCLAILFGCPRTLFALCTMWPDWAILILFGPNVCTKAAKCVVTFWLICKTFIFNCLGDFLATYGRFCGAFFYYLVTLLVQLLLLLWNGLNENFSLSSLSLVHTGFEKVKILLLNLLSNPPTTVLNKTD